MNPNHVIQKNENSFDHTNESDFKNDGYEVKCCIM